MINWSDAPLLIDTTGRYHQNGETDEHEIRRMTSKMTEAKKSNRAATIIANRLEEKSEMNLI